MPVELFPSRKVVEKRVVEGKAVERGEKGREPALCCCSCCLSQARVLVALLNYFPGCLLNYFPPEWFRRKVDGKAAE